MKLYKCTVSFHDDIVYDDIEADDEDDAKQQAIDSAMDDIPDPEVTVELIRDLEDPPEPIPIEDNTEPMPGQLSFEEFLLGVSHAR